MDTLPFEVAAYLMHVLSDYCLPIPRGIVMHKLRLEDVEKNLARSLGAGANKRADIFRALRIAYRPTTRLRCVSRAFAAAPWLLGWAELYDYLLAERRWSASAHLSHVFTQLVGSNIHQLSGNYAIDAQLKSCTDSASKALAVQYLFQQGNSAYYLTYPKNIDSLAAEVRALDPDCPVPQGPFFYSFEEHYWITAAQRIAARRTDPNDVCFPVIGVEHHASVTGALRVHFLDELHLHKASPDDRYWNVRTEANGGGRRVNLAMARVHAVDERTGKRRQLPMAALKRSVLRQWAVDFAAQQEATHFLLQQLRASQRVRAALAKQEQLLRAKRPRDVVGEELDGQRDPKRSRTEDIVDAMEVEES